MTYYIYFGRGHVRVVSGEEAAWYWFGKYCDAAYNTDVVVELVDGETGELLANNRGYKA